MDQATSPHPATKLIIGCGFLGRRVAARWLAQGDSVSALTRSPENAAQLRSLGIAAVLGDVTDASSLGGLPPAETVLYAVGLDRRSGRSQREVYVDGLENVLRHLPDCATRFIYISSTSVYGQDSGEWVDESSACEPSTANGEVCLDAERTLRRYRPEAIVLRLAGIYGSGRLVARLDRLRSGMLLEGNPEAWLNLIHVDDAATAVVECERRGKPGETYLGCDDKPHRRRDYYQLLARAAAAPEPHFDAATFDAAARARLGKRCRNRRLREELRVALGYPTIETGLPAALLAGDAR
ncbi:MAG: SDR family oxidoreductase [Planctomycetaceae bacterium]